MLYVCRHTDSVCILLSLLLIFLEATYIEHLLRISKDGLREVKRLAKVTQLVNSWASNPRPVMIESGVCFHCCAIAVMRC